MNTKVHLFGPLIDEGTLFYFEVPECYLKEISCNRKHCRKFVRSKGAKSSEPLSRKVLKQ